MTTPYKVEIILRCTSISGGGVTVICQWTQGSDNWGTALETDGRDWTTTDEYTEEGVLCDTANTYYKWEIDPSLIDFTKVLYVRFRDSAENDTNTKNSTFASANNSTSDYRPKCRITYLNPNGGTTARLLSLTGIGS